MQRRIAIAWRAAMSSILTMTPGLAQASTATEMKSRIEQSAILYFQENANPTSGLVRDASENFEANPASNQVASMAATGYGLTVIANASLRGLVDKVEAERYVLKTLKFSRDHVPRFKGWFLHFVDWETGARAWYSEYSTIDTALFMAGALYAAQVFPGSEISAITRELYNDLDFENFLHDGGAAPSKKTLSMAYLPENGYTKAQWDGFAEHMILLVLGLGHPTHPLPRETWGAWDRTATKLADGDKLMGFSAPLFIHQYSQLYMDFRDFSDGFGSYYLNGALATRTHRAIAKSDARYQTLQEGFWGFSAGQSPRGYDVWDPTHYVGTVCIGCTIASVVYWPDTVSQDLASWYDGPRHNSVWGRYGFIDSLDIDQNWFAHQVLGITVGPAYMSFADIDPDTSIWKLFMQIPEIRAGLAKAKSPSSEALQCSASNT